MSTQKLVFIVFISVVFNCGCKKLNETYGGNLTTGQVANNATAELLRGVYTSLASTFTTHEAIFPLSELTTDAGIAPTRGTDWDDNGVYRALHQHRWDANNKFLRIGFNSLSGTVYAATDILRYNPSLQETAEAKFLRSFAMYWLLDLFDQVPYRDPGENLIQPARVRKGLDALEFIITQLSEAMADLPDAPVYKANKNAAKVLLMKCYLNKAIYGNRGNINPSHQATDMNKVIGLADEVIKSGRFSFSQNYFGNFAPDNSDPVTIRENIFTHLNVAGLTTDYNVQSAWFMVFHYYMNPSGWNGFATLSDFYNKFEAADKRRGLVYSTTSSPPNPGNRINVGFLKDQQYDPTTDAPLIDRNHIPLVFTPEVKNIETYPNLEGAGIRPLKYFPDFANPNSPDNDFVFFRFSDVLLMKAEAILRGGNGTTAGIYGDNATLIVNSIRTHSSRNATPLSSVTLENLLDERGRELWWEGWRRQDLIRFNKFLKPFQEKNYQSDIKYLLFPIPAAQLAVNPNLVQHQGY